MKLKTKYEIVKEFYKEKWLEKLKDIAGHLTGDSFFSESLLN